MSDEVTALNALLKWVWAPVFAALVFFYKEDRKSQISRVDNLKQESDERSKKLDISVESVEEDLLDLTKAVGTLQATAVNADKVREIIKDEVKSIKEQQDRSYDQQQKVFEKLDSLSAQIAKAGFINRRDN